MIEYVDTAIFGFFISIFAFLLGTYINKKVKIELFHPLLIAIVLIIAFMKKFDIDYEVYMKGGELINFFLGPATIILSVPLYKQLDKLKENGIVILLGIFIGCLTAILSVFYLSKLMGLSGELALSMIPKSATGAISREISAQIGGVPALTVAFTVLTGISGNIIGPYIFKIFRITDEIAQGVALGTASHGVGTARAIELGEVQGAMGSMSIGIAGLITVFLAPFLLSLLG